MIRAIAAAFATTALLASAALAGDATMTVDDPYARTSSPAAKSGAAFMMLTNHGDVADRLVAATSDVAERVEIHTHIEDANGVMRMIEVEDGIAIGAGASHMLKRGGDHVMFMGIKEPFVNGESVEVTLTFEVAGDITIEIPVDNDRAPADHGHGHHGGTN